MTRKISQKTTKILVNVCSMILACTFLFSGFVKANDPYGTVYKMQDYLASVGMYDTPEYLVIIAAIMLAFVEFTMGVYLLFGIDRKRSSWLTVAFMTVMTLITIYIYIYNPVSDCGCFGDAIILSNGATLLKNIVLLAMAVYVMRNKDMQLELLRSGVKWLVSTASMTGIVVFAIWCIIKLPLIDFRPFKVGTDLRALHEAASNPDLFDIKIVYERNGETLELSPEDDDPDSTWQYVETKRTLTNSEALQTSSFYINDPESGDEITEDVLYDDSFVFLLVIPNLNNADESCVDKVDEIYDYTQEEGFAFYCLTASADSESQVYWNDHTGADYPFYISDERVLKTVVRASPGLVLLKDGKIISKWGNYSLPTLNELKETLKQHNV
ncbi:MAG: DoxX family membrane protein [Bacteroidaceae bacterium]|nr:DoxX family membrane protein [Bacteroidaceae bacterium]